MQVEYEEAPTTFTTTDVLPKQQAESEAQSDEDDEPDVEEEEEEEEEQPGTMAPAGQWCGKSDHRCRDRRRSRRRGVRQDENETRDEATSIISREATWNDDLSDLKSQEDL